MNYVPKNNLAERLKSIIGVDSSIPSNSVTNGSSSQPVNTKLFVKNKSFSGYSTKTLSNDTKKSDESKHALQIPLSKSPPSDFTGTNNKNDSQVPSFKNNTFNSNHRATDSTPLTRSVSQNSTHKHQLLKPLNYTNETKTPPKDISQLQASLDQLIEQKIQVNEKICETICDRITHELNFQGLKEQRQQIISKIDRIKEEINSQKTSFSSNHIIPSVSSVTHQPPEKPLNFSSEKPIVVNHSSNSTKASETFSNGNQSFPNKPETTGNFGLVRTDSFKSPPLVDLSGFAETIDLDDFSSDEEAPTKPPEKDYPWTSDIYFGLKKVFKLESFRPNQLAAINSTLAGEDVFVLMPTGGGKSLCYQLPAIINSGRTQGLTIVVSPLLSLVQDQVTRLLQLGIIAATINGESTAAQRKFFFDELSKPKPIIKLAYLTPELLMNSEATQNTIRKLYERNQLARFVIDEAHCVSQWGHDFRKDYKEIGSVKKQYSDIPFIALTATANSKVKLDIMQNLNIQGCKIISQSFNRKNLYYEVRRKNAKTLIDDIYAFITSHFANQTGIIYNSSRAKCEETAQQLVSRYKLKAAYYHAGLASEDRRQIQEQFLNGSLRIIVATIAFGMGIDKSNVRFVIHCCFPSSLEGYYQETGRAGRDGLPATCVLFYTFKDKSFHDFLIDKSEGNFASKERLRANVRGVLQYCENKFDCRRQLVLAYFDEKFDKSLCNLNCDNCQRSRSDSFIKEDFTDLAKKAVLLVKKIQHEKVTLLQLMDIFRGSGAAKFKKFNIPSIGEFGAGSSKTRIEIERLFHQLIILGLLIDKPEMTNSGFPASFLSVTPTSENLFNGTQKILIDTPIAEKRLAPASLEQSKRTKTTNSNKTINTSVPPQTRSRKQPSVCSTVGSKITFDAPLLNDKNSEFRKEILDTCYQQLKLLRTTITVNERVLPFNVFSDTALVKMMETLPDSIDDIKNIETVTALSAKKYGPQFLSLIAVAKAKIDSRSQVTDLTNNSATESDLSTGNTSHYFANSSAENSSKNIQNNVLSRSSSFLNNPTTNVSYPIDLDFEEIFDSD